MKSLKRQTIIGNMYYKYNNATILIVAYFTRLPRNFTTSATSLSAGRKSCTVRSEFKFY